MYTYPENGKVEKGDDVRADNKSEWHRAKGLTGAVGDRVDWWGKGNVRRSV